MKTISLGVAMCPNEAVEVLDAVDVVEELEEDGEDGHGMRLGTDTSIIISNSREGNLCSYGWSVRLKGGKVVSRK